MKFSPRSTVAILAAAQIVFLIALVGVLAYIAQVGNDADRTNLRLGQINRAAIQRDCRDKEELKVTISEILKAVIVFNSRSESPELRERVATYQRLLSKLDPLPCN